MKNAALRVMLSLALCLALLASAALGEQADGAIFPQTEAAEAAATDGEAAEAAQPERGLEVYYFDVERVDAILIRCEGVACFVDVLSLIHI